MCVVDSLSTGDNSLQLKNNQNSLIPIDVAYKEAKEEAAKEDTQLNEKRNNIDQQLAKLKDRMKKIKENANNIQSTITEMLEKCFGEVYDNVTKKCNILKSDRLELVRQY